MSFRSYSWLVTKSVLLGAWEEKGKFFKIVVVLEQSHSVSEDHYMLPWKDHRGKIDDVNEGHVVSKRAQLKCERREMLEHIDGESCT